jgi:hypothetical protein
MVQTGLREILAPDALMEAVRLCETEFRREPVFSVNRFVERLSEVRPDLQSNKGMMFRALITRSARRAENGAPVARTAVQPAPVPAPATNGTAGGWPVVFNHLLRELSATFVLLDGEAFRSLAAHLERNVKISEESRREMREWLATSRPGFTRLVSQPEMHQVLHHTYVWACMEMGPVDADKHFARAVRSAGSLPEAVHYRPQSLL